LRRHTRERKKKLFSIDGIPVINAKALGLSQGVSLEFVQHVMVRERSFILKDFFRLEQSVRHVMAPAL